MAPRYIDPCSKIIREAMLKIEEKLKNEIVEDDEGMMKIVLLKLYPSALCYRINYA